MLTETQLIQEIRDIGDFGHVELFTGDGQKQEFVLKKRPFRVEIQEIIECNIENCEIKGEHTHVKKIEDNEYDLNFKEHTISFKNSLEKNIKIQVLWNDKNLEDDLSEEGFIRIKGNEDLKEAFERIYPQGRNGFYWHQVVRLALINEENR